MTTDTGSTVPRRQLGRHLRQLREEARMTVKAAATALEWSTPKIWRIETGATSMRSLDVEAMCKVYGASPEITEALMGLAKETRARGWWHSYGDAIPEWFELYVGLESGATRLRKYEAHLIPGLLQTKAYATRVYEAGRPDMKREDVDRGVALRLDRQALLTRATPPAPQVDIILDEAVLRRDIDAEQLNQIVTVSRQPNVSVRVVPFSAGLHRATLANGAFTILDFDGSDEPTIVYADGLTGALYLDKPAEAAAYEEVWSTVESTALSEAQSRKLISSIAEELT
ncbi:MULTISPECIES: helix-turn-helix domain-containing protein [unclassified Solwaraspora]|uniref:helix-turn-helix domain-containing protein n=1 Tax=unclassified Solwaraspora TaxID=2627926 RepID=UPI00259B6FEC|nr:helix-turn-helix transcriptional regulator [Solwaraspora sp. WMMA2056]WJK42017.1 helix-turn-helix transcriptional regulator [Solwaraspora sp. WMMA2056]